MFADTRRYLGCGHPGSWQWASKWNRYRGFDIHVEKKDIHSKLFLKHGRLFQSHWLLMKDVGWLGLPNHNIVTSRVLVHDTHLACQNLKLQLPPQIQPLRPRLDGTCILDGSKMSHKFIFRDVPLRGEIRQNRSDMYFLKSCISYRQCRIFAYQTQTQKPQHFTYASGRSTQMGGEKENHVLGSISHSS